MVKLFTLLLLVGATNLVAAPTPCIQATSCEVLLIGGGTISESIVGDIIELAAPEWQVTEFQLWNEYRAKGISIKKVGISNGEPVYQVDRLATGGSLVLILDVEAA